MKRFLWLIPALALLVGAYYLPEIWLHERERRAGQTVYYGEASPAIDTQSFYDKLNIVSQSDTMQASSFGLEEDEAVYERYYDEIARLSACGIITDEMRERLQNDMCYIYRMVLLDVDGEISVSLYEVIYTEHDTLVWFDAQSGWILRLNLPDVIDESYVLDDFMSKSVSSDADWAAYYGVKASDCYRFDDYLGDNGYCIYAQMLQFDEGEIPFCITYERTNCAVICSPRDEDYLNEWIAVNEAAESNDTVGANAENP